MVKRPGRCYAADEIVEFLRDRAFDLVCIASFRAACLEEFARLYGRAPFSPLVFIDGADDDRIRFEVVERYPIGICFKLDYVWMMEKGLGEFLAREWAFRGNRRLRFRTVPPAPVAGPGDSPADWSGQ